MLCFTLTFMTTTVTKPLRAVIYTRVSSDKDGGGRSVAEQEAECRRYCEQQGWDLVTVLTDNDRSATRWARQQRPAFEELFGLLRPVRWTSWSLGSPPVLSAI